MMGQRQSFDDIHRSHSNSIETAIVAVVLPLLIAWLNIILFMIAAGGAANGYANAFLHNAIPSNAAYIILFGGGLLLSARFILDSIMNNKMTNTLLAFQYIKSVVIFAIAFGFFLNVPIMHSYFIAFFIFNALRIISFILLFIVNLEGMYFSDSSLQRIIIR